MTSNRIWLLLLALGVLSGSLLARSAAAALRWDANPGNPSPEDGSGSWGQAAGNLNWWNGSTNVAWNNESGAVAVIGINSGNNYMVTVTNGVVTGGLVYSNAGTGIYSIGVANGATLGFSGPAPVIQFSGPGGLHPVGSSLVATGGLSILAASETAATGIIFRAAALTNHIAGLLSVGTTGNAVYTNRTGIYADFNNGTLANVLAGTTNVTVHSNAMIRISGQNGSPYNLPFPKRFILSGDGQNGTRGAWLITGDAGGTFNAAVELAGDTTIMTTVGSGGSPTFTINGRISGAGNLRLANDNNFASKPTLTLSSGPAAYNGIRTVIGGNLAVRLQGGDNRLSPSSALTLGITNAPVGATWNGYGRLVLGNSSGPVRQVFTGLSCDGVTAGSAVVGGNAGGISGLTISNGVDCHFAGTLGGAVVPESQLALTKEGSGRLTLAGTNQCAGGFTVLGGVLEFGDGLSEKPLAGPITNQSTVVFNVSGSRAFGDLVTGSGSLAKIGVGKLVWNGINASAGASVVSQGTLSGEGLFCGPVSVQPAGTLAPGSGIGMLIISNSLALAGSTELEIDKLAFTNDSVRGLSSVTYGGTLVLINVAGNYAAGDAFKLFHAASYQGVFTNLVPSQPGPGRAWDTNTLATDGTLRIITNSTPNHPPSWVANPVFKPTAATNVSYTESLVGAATDPDIGDTLSFSKVGGPDWLVVAPDGTLSGIPLSSDLGSNTFTVRVTDSGGLDAEARLAIAVIGDLNAPVQLASPNGRLVVTFAVSDFDGSVACPVYSLNWSGQPALAASKLGLTFGGLAWCENVTVTSRTSGARTTTWSPVWGERSLVRDNYNELTVELQEATAPNRVVQVTFRAYDEGAAFCYTIPTQAGLTNVSSLTEQSEFRFTGNHPTWSVTSAQGGYAASNIGSLPNGNERPLTVRVETNLFVALGEARLVDYARMKFNRAAAANSLVSALSSSVAGPLPLRSPWRFVMAAETPARLLENNDLILNLNDSCELTNTAWIQPGKVIREVSLNTTGGVACVDFAVKHNLQYIEFDAGWYGPENTAPSATNVNVDPARSPGPLDLQYVIDYGRSNGVGVILYVNKLALANQIDILPALYQGWGVAGMKFGFVNVGSQSDTRWLHDSIRKCATNQILVDVHDEYRMTGYSRTYPNFLTAEGIRGDEETPSASQDLVTLFTRMLAGPADHTMCFYDRRVTNNWNHAYQLAKAVCFFSPWQFLYWYDRPINSPGYAANANAMITEDPALEFYDHMPTVWDDTKVVQGSIGQFAIIARRRGADWFVGAMNAGTNRTLDLSLDFLAPGRTYIAHRFYHDSTLNTRTRVRIDRMAVCSTNSLVLSLTAADGQALRITPIETFGFQSLWFENDGSLSMAATGKVLQPFSWWTTTNPALPVSAWTLMNTGLFTNPLVRLQDTSASSFRGRFYLLSSP